MGVRRGSVGWALDKPTASLSTAMLMNRLYLDKYCERMNCNGGVAVNKNTSNGPGAGDRHC